MGSKLTKTEICKALREHLHSEDECLLTLAESAFEKCIFGRIREPEGILKRQWIAPGEWYDGHWIWDSMFVADLLSVLPGNEEILRDAFRVYWDFQDFWNEKVPDYARWMVANNIKPNGYTPFTQSECIIAWAMERIYRRNCDICMLKEGLERLERYHDWYWNERDVNSSGLIGVGTYACLIKGCGFDSSAESVLQSARYETFDFQPPLDGLKLTPHPVRRDAPSLYGDISLPDATAFLIQAEHSLISLAELAGDRAMAQRRRPRIEKSVDAMRRHMWDEEAGTFLAVKRDSLEKVRIPAIGSWIPLFAGVPTPEQAARMASELRKPDWFTSLPIPTVGRSSPYFDDAWGRDISRNGIMWRGDVWNPTNYLICSGLAACGQKELAAEIADRTVANVLAHGLNECYHPDTGLPLRVDNLGMSCTAVTMVLDGLTHDYKMAIRK